MARRKKEKRQAPHCADTRAVSGVKGFAGIPKCLLESEAYRHLSIMARAVLVEIVARMNGHNNGAITISYKELARRLNRHNQAPFAPAIAELMEHGLLDISEASIWQERRARAYRLTFVATSDSIGRTVRATNDYVNWRPGRKSDATDVVAEQPKSATPFVAAKIAAATNAVADPHAKLPNMPSASATDAVAPIYRPYAGRLAPARSGEAGR